MQFATAEIGVILVNINPAYRTHELAYAVQQSGCRFLIAAPSFRTSEYVEMVEHVHPDCPQLERAIFLWDDEWDELVSGTNGAGDALPGESSVEAAVDDAATSVQEGAAEAGSASGDVAEEAASETAEAINDAFDTVDRESNT